MPHLFIIYDERAMLGETDEAAVLCTAKSLKEARRDVREMFPRGVIYRYDIQPKPNGNPVPELINETFIEGPK